MVKVTQTVEPTIKTQDLMNKKEDFSKDTKIDNKIKEEDKQQEKKEIIINKPKQRTFSAESKNDKSTFNDIDKQYKSARLNLVESGKIEAILALPNKLFKNVDISVQC